ncbi:hypothetical protein E4656_10885 [Natronospirillum operosum]|uniref:Uncharacterized protein n=1 Tax=Natronospirillum operosum TaxID=2759953 RepID=A0A4Z0WF26_9GAMM|nr:hypothetical protein [Natronospirillum operosum]TGG93541.1 hypothetical protein E4656_10885 [Natronospirillum operosum]
MPTPTGPLLYHFKRRDILKAALAGAGIALVPTTLIAGTSQTSPEAGSARSGKRHNRLNIGVL